MIENIDEFKQYFTRIALLLDIELTNESVKSIFRFTNYDIPIKDEETNSIYKPLAFSLNDVSYGLSNQVDDIKLTIDNTQQLFNSIFLNYDQRKNYISLYFVVLDENANIQSKITLFSGFISSIQISNKQIEITAKNELVYWNNSPLRIYTVDLFPNLADVNPTDTLKWGVK